MIFDKRLELEALSLYEAGYSISVPKFKMDYGEHGKIYTVMLYAFRDLDDEDDFSLAFPSSTRDVPYFFNEFEEFDKTVFEENCDYY